jgi:RimJ/RimL family protein N-acetyltransferase
MDKAEFPRGSERRSKLRKPRALTGARLRFRDASVEDAEFILSLRLDPVKNAHLSKTLDDLDAQRAWLHRYASDDGQAYFIITHDEAAIGTIRVYDVRETSFSWGSWILTDGAPRSSAVESTLMIYAFGLACNFAQSHFEVRRANEKVWQYHERCGAVRVGEDQQDYFYEIDEQAMRALLARYSSRIPNGVAIDWGD